MFATLLGKFRFIALLEGCSYLLLLLIGMPLKYFYNEPDALKFLGWAHGLLFILFCYFLLRVWIHYKWTFLKVVLAFIASLLPFGTFVLDARLKKEQTQEA